MTIIFLNKNTPSLMATKIIKKSGISFVFAQRNAAHCISGQNKWLGAGITRGVAARTEPSDGEYEKHLRAEPQDWTGGGNFTRHICRELNRKRDGGLGSRDTRDGTPSSVVEEYLLGNGQLVAG